MKSLLIRWVALGAAFWVAARFLTGVHVTNNDFFTYAGLALMFGLVNAVIGTILRVFTFPITFLTLGLWAIAINALMLLLTDTWSDSLTIDSFWWAMAAAVVIGVCSAIVNKTLKTLTKSK